jgi:serine/threonine-protein kinase RsbW
MHWADVLAHLMRTAKWRAQTKTLVLQEASQAVLFNGFFFDWYGMADSAPLLPVTLTCNTEIRFIDLIQVVGAELIKHMSFTPEDGEKIWLAVQEGITNAMRHGNGMDSSKTVTVLFVPSPEQLEIRISDQGRGVDLESVPDPNLPENLLKPCGRGIFLMKQVMDLVEMTATEQGNTLVLIKHRKGRRRAAS